MTTRRNFIKLASTGTLGAALISTPGLANSQKIAKGTRAFTIGIAGYTFLAYNNNIDKIIEVMNALSVTYISLKNFQLPYESTQQQVNEILGKFKAAGINVYGLGVIYLKTETDVDNAFAYARMAAVKIIIASPAFEILNYVEKKAKEYGMRIAIHNHGPEDKLFPDIDSIYEKIKTMDPLIGICLDVGHTFRCGHDPAKMLLKYKDRIYDMHVKDVDEPVEKGHTVINGRGKMDFVSLVKALDKSGYSGSCSLEFEQKDDPAMGLAECVGHFKGVLASV